MMRCMLAVSIAVALVNCKAKKEPPIELDPGPGELDMFPPKDLRKHGNHASPNSTACQSDSDCTTWPKDEGCCDLCDGIPVAKTWAESETKWCAAHRSDLSRCPKLDCAETELKTPTCKDNVCVTDE